MKRTLYLMVMFLSLLRTMEAQTIPKELWGTWVVRREVPTSIVQFAENRIIFLLTMNANNGLDAAGTPLHY